MVSALSFCIAYVIVDVLCMVLTVIVSSNISRDSGSETQVRYFFLLLTAHLVFVVFDAAWAILVFSQLFEPTKALLALVNGINLCAIAAEGYFWFCFSLSYFNSPVIGRLQARIALALPLLLAPVLHVVGYFTGQNVIFMPDGSIAYGSMHAAVTAVPSIYLVAATALALRRFRCATTRRVRRMSLVFIGFMVAPAVACAFDLLVPDMPVVAAAVMVSIVFVMLAMQEARISSDALTGLNNRRRADLFLEDRIAHATTGCPLYAFIIDMDRFKLVNDTYGHLEGDRALNVMADALRNTATRLGAFCARWGGDEFVLIGSANKIDDPSHVAHLIQAALANQVLEAGLEYELGCSVGYAVCTDSEQSASQLLANADQMLYAHKRIAHRLAAERQARR